MSRGYISYSKVRAVTRVATPENEKELLEIARGGTAGQTERIMRAWPQSRPSSREGTRERAARPSEPVDVRRCRRDRHDPRQAARRDRSGVPQSARSRIGSHLPPRHRTTTRAPPGGSVEAHLRGGAEGRARPGPQLRPVPGRGARRRAGAARPGTAGTVPRSKEASASPRRRLDRIACDASIVEMQHDEYGNVLDVWAQDAPHHTFDPARARRARPHVRVAGL